MRTKEEAKAYRAANQKEIKAYQTAYRIAHREELKAWHAAHYAENREEIKTSRAAYRDEHPDKAKTYRAAHRKERKSYQASHSEEIKAVRRKHLYGLSPGAFHLLMLFQSGACGICKKKFTKTPFIDHDHATDEVRGLLCNNCNRGLGFFKDSPAILAEAMDYLKL